METADRRVPTGGEQDPLGIDRRSRRAFTVSLLVVVIVVIVALGYSWFRDPGPQPTYPPKISGTEDGALKRAIVHYQGALESGNAAEVIRLMGDDTNERAQNAARSAVERYSGSAKGKATVVVRPDPEFGGVALVTMTFDDGLVHRLNFFDSGGGPWRPSPMTDPALTDQKQPASPSAASPAPAAS